MASSAGSGVLTATSFVLVVIRSGENKLLLI